MTVGFWSVTVNQRRETGQGVGSTGKGHDEKEQVAGKPSLPDPWRSLKRTGASWTGPMGQEDLWQSESGGGLIVLSLPMSVS